MRTAGPRCVDFHSLHPMAILYNAEARDLLPMVIQFNMDWRSR
jgi:hypothetical protein